MPTLSRGPRSSRLGLCFLAALSLGGLSGCMRGMVDAFVVGPVIDRGTDVPDVDKACTMGTALVNVIATTGESQRSPHKALLVAEANAGLCDEAEGWEAGLEAVRLEQTRPSSDPGKVAEVRDARLKEARARARAADRFYRAWRHAEAVWGPVGEGGCPRIKPRDEFAYLLGMYAGTVAMLHDKASGSTIGVPSDLLTRVARGVTCLDAQRWWQVPQALQAATWATVPGSGPAEVDPWQQLEQAAVAGEASGVRLNWALLTMMAANADREETLRLGIQRHAAALASRPQDPEWALLDEYARLVTLHESDLLWTQATGHRTPVLGELPPGSEEASPTGRPEDDPFGDPGAAPPK